MGRYGMTLAALAIAGCATGAGAEDAPRPPARRPVSVGFCAPLCHVDVDPARTAAERAATLAKLSKDERMGQNVCMLSCISRNLPDADPRKAMMASVARQAYDSAKAQGVDIKAPDLKTRDAPAGAR